MPYTKELAEGAGSLLRAAREEQEDDWDEYLRDEFEERGELVAEGRFGNEAERGWYCVLSSIDSERSGLQGESPYCNALCEAREELGLNLLTPSRRRSGPPRDRGGPPGPASGPANTAHTAAGDATQRAGGGGGSSANYSSAPGASSRQPPAGAGASSSSHGGATAAPTADAVACTWSALAMVMSLSQSHALGDARQLAWQRRCTE